jgi:hypothetical protein
MTDKKGGYILDGCSVEHVRNRSELKAVKILGEVLPEFEDFDHCQLCIEDIYGLTINQLPGRYVQVGGLNLNRDGLTDDEIRDIARDSIRKVIGNPSHPVRE